MANDPVMSIRNLYSTLLKGTETELDKRIRAGVITSVLAFPADGYVASKVANKHIAAKQLFNPKKAALPVISTTVYLGANFQFYAELTAHFSLVQRNTVAAAPIVGALSTIGALACVIPLRVLSTLQQINTQQQVGVWELFKKTHARYGVNAWLISFRATAMRDIPANMAMFTVMEAVKANYSGKNVDMLAPLAGGAAGGVVGFFPHTVAMKVRSTVLQTIQDPEKCLEPNKLQRIPCDFRIAFDYWRSGGFIASAKTLAPWVYLMRLMVGTLIMTKLPTTELLEDKIPVVQADSVKPSR